MSAIGGIYHLDQAPVSSADLNRMASSMCHRGPDVTNVWQNGPLGFVNCLLRTTPESAYENLPLVSQDGLLVLSADARLDNRGELLSVFDFSGKPHVEIPDSALLLAAYQRWGKRSVEHLVGDFSFALWDEPEKKLFCARDHMGIRPFYYVHSQQTFGFASEMKALLTLPTVRRRVNEAKLVDFLLWEYYDKKATFYEDIFRLPPAHTLTISADGIHAEQYWELDPDYEIRLGSDEAYAEKFLEIFSEAVRCRLRSITPVGSMLSGGLDSSAVTCVARNQLAGVEDHTLFTFSGIFPSLAEVDESKYIEHVVAQGGLTPHFIRVDELGFLSDLERLSEHLEEPHPFPNLNIVWSALGIAKTEGIRVLLDGNDGDAAVSHGLGILAEMAYRGEWANFASVTASLAQKYDAYERVPQRLLEGYGFFSVTQMFRDGDWQAGIRAINQVSKQFKLTRLTVIKETVWRRLILRAIRQWKRRRTLPSDLKQLIVPSLAKRIDIRERQSHLEQRPVRTARQEQINTLTSCWLVEALDALDKTGAAFGVELRHPFFDKRLVEYCVALPVNQKIDAGWTRMILRRSMQNILPSEIQWREGKSNLEPNFVNSFLGVDHERLDEAILRDPAPLELYLEVPVLQEIYRQFLKNPSGAAARKIWSAVVLRDWLKQNKLS